MSEFQVQMICLTAAFLGFIFCVAVAHHYRKQDQKDAERRAQLHADLEAELRRPR